MIAALLIGFALIGQDQAAEAARTRPDARTSYEAERARAAKNPEGQIRLALWCEEHGLIAERIKHLAMAVIADPSNAAARGLLGLVRDDGQWRKPEAVADRINGDPSIAATLAEYIERRARTPNQADAQWKLGLWCDQRGLRPEAIAHFSAVTRLDPGREDAWKRLGCRKFEGRWLNEAEIHEEKAETDAQRKADIHWKHQLEAWKATNSTASPTRRADLDAAMASVHDPRAVRMTWTVFARGGSSLQLKAVRIFGQIESAAASKALATLAVGSTSAEVRGVATETLARRDPREFLGALIPLLADPIKYQVKPVGGPGSPGVLFVEGKQLDPNRMLVYSPPPPPNFSLQPGDIVELDANGLPVVDRRVTWTHLGTVNTGRAIERVQIKETDLVAIPVGERMAEARRAAMVAQQQLKTEVDAIERANVKTREKNERVAVVLFAVTGKSDLGLDRESWNAWWTDQQGYAYIPPSTPSKPTIVEQVPIAYQVQPIADQALGIVGSSYTRAHHSCFGGGTLIQTLTGRRPIEDLKVGDLVLAQDVATGSLDYQPILAVYHNPPSPTLRMTLGGDDEIVVTGIHRLWKAGVGWTMARDLKPGDSIRTLGGSDIIGSIAPGATQPVFNLEVASGHSYFVTRLGALAHDNSLVRPVSHPFDSMTIAAK